MSRPADELEPYINSDPVIGSMAGFEFGSRLGRVELKDICIKLYKDQFPMSYLASIGPKSYRRNGWEIFDPDLNSSIDCLTMENILVNGEKMTDCRDIVHQIVFEDIYGDGTANGRGVINKILLDGKPQEL